MAKRSQQRERETFISVDIEADGPVPGDYSMVSFGACVVGSDDPRDEFYLEIRHMTDNFVPEALAVSGFDRAYLRNCEQPDTATEKIAGWLDEMQADHSGRLVMVGFNASFDWSFVNYYLHHFVGRNPLGISALDIKALYMGKSGCNWASTSMSRLPRHVRPATDLTHNALQDARDQATIFQNILSSN
jgi:DNA polymerase III epsilon subunit-like protein